MGEAVLQYEANRLGLPVTVDSAGTAGYHEGDPPDERTVSTCRKNGVPINSMARQIRRSDFKDFTYILAADTQNLANIQRLAPKKPKAQIALFGSFGDDRPISDPYYGGQSGFDECFRQCVQYSRGFLREVYGAEAVDNPQYPANSDI